MTLFLRATGLVLFSVLTVPAGAQGRYSEPPPVMVNSDISAPWVMQLRSMQPPSPQRQQQRQAAPASRPAVQPAAASRQISQHYQPPQITGRRPKDYSHLQLHPRFLPQEVQYEGKHSAGTIVVDTKQKYLYLVLSQGQAMRYGVGVGKDGFGFTGTYKVSNKREWPDWRPPADMIAREKKRGHTLPVHMTGGPLNPLGARALYLGSTLYRIHGTNAPWTIGQSVSSGCIRMRNEDVIDLYERVTVGTNVVVI